ncbi:UNVERIFIED_CONTAM: hypothetical protein Sradi_5248000 [Sesamum radiatum]|uniref:Uncharacterized protein n=1 Tax=Sesamum radiatum TaxID=300843 RepID=A0AAW2LL40_SESRA
MKDTGETNVIFGIKLIRSTDGIDISRSHYVEKIIEKFGYQDCRIAEAPHDHSVALFKNEIGVLVSQLRYLKRITSQTIHYGRSPVVLDGYSDASWIAKNFESNGCSGHVFTLSGGSPGSLQNKL